MTLSAEQITIFLLSISIMLFAAKAFGELFIKIGQPAIIGEIIAGIILGPTILGSISPEAYHWLFPADTELRFAMDGMINIAVILLLLVFGLEVDLSIVLKQGKTAISTALLGIILPFSLGFTVSYSFPELMGIDDPNKRLTFALFIGTALSISALPIIAKALMDLNMFKTEIGLIIIAAAMFNDLVGWLIFSIILGMIGVGGHGMSFGTTLILTISFVIVVLIFGRRLINKILPWVQDKLAFPGGILNFILILGFLSAAFTEYIGIHAIFGAFIMGIAIGDSAYLKERTREVIQQFVTNIFAPLFFVSIGLRVNFITSFDLITVLIIVSLAFVGKVTGCGLGAYWSGMSRNDSLIIGFGLNSIGAMGIILGLIALQYGLIEEKVFVALVIMALITSISSPPFMKFFMRKNEAFSLDNLITPSNIYFSEARDRETLFKELLEVSSKKLKIPGDAIYDKLIESEKRLPSGVANHLAIPHIKVKSRKPHLSIAISRNGINFEAADKLPAKIIFLLFAPEKSPQIQLKVLSDIAKKFRDDSMIHQITELSDTEQISDWLKKL